jgi:hypothetical protein
MIAIPSELAVSPVLLCYEMDAFPENPDWPELKKWYVAPHARQLDCARGQAKTIAVKLAICGRNSSSQLGAKTGRPPQDISALPSSIAAIDAQKPLPGPRAGEFNDCASPAGMTVAFPSLLSTVLVR